MKKNSKTAVMMLLEKIAGSIGKPKLGLIAFIFLMMLSFSASAHVFEIRYNQASNGSITWYLISYHGTSQCPNESAGLTINGTNFPIQTTVLGDARPLSSNIFVQDLECYTRVNPGFPPIAVNDLYVSYGIITTPFIGGALTVTPFSNAVCFAFCIGGTVEFNPPPVINCPANVSQNADTDLCSAAVTVPSPSVIDNCTYSGGNPEMVANGDFSAQAANWNNCGNAVEAFCTETCYGGSNGANRVAEIDHQPVTLCQNISGFIPGKIYELKFKASRRVGAPATVGAIVKIDGAALLETVNRTNTSFSLTDETFTFFATQATHQLTFVPTAGWGGTFGFIVDDISIKKKLGSITNNFNNTADASGTYPVGVTNVVWTIVDCTGEAHTCNQTVTVNDNQPPVITCPANIAVNNDAGLCGASVGFAATATDNCSATITYSHASGSVFPVGTTTLTATATDAAGNTAECSFNVTVTDNEAPIISLANVFSCYEANNNGCTINLGVTASDNCAVASLTSNAPACFPVGTTTVTWTAMDVNGNSSTATQTVTRNPEMHVNICAGPTRTIYKGTTNGVGPFGPQSVNLTSSASGGTPGYTYSWSPAIGLNNAAIANPVASPLVTTIYTLTVTDSKGCTRSLSITVKVLPLSAALCGQGNNIKFKVCHVPPGNPSNSHGICISVNALNAHLTSGSNGHQNCYLGDCDELCFSTTSQTSRGGATDVPIASQAKSIAKVNIDLVKEFTVNASPNPAKGSFVLQFNSDDANTGAIVRVIDATGKVIETFRNILPGKSVRFGELYSGGSYYVEVVQGSNRKVLQLLKVN
jgi:hypothetical protein